MQEKQISLQDKISNTLSEIIAGQDKLKMLIELLKIKAKETFDVKVYDDAIKSISKGGQVPLNAKLKVILAKLWYQKGLFQAEFLQDYANALGSLNKSLELKGDNPLVIEKRKELFKHFLVNGTLYTETLIRSFVIQPRYSIALQKLKYRHHELFGKHISPDIAHNLEHLLSIINFLNSFYNKPEFPFNFIQNDFLTENESSDSLRQRSFGVFLNQIINHFKLPQIFSAKEVFKTIKERYSEVIFTDAIVLLRFVIEAIHYLPRNFRDQYNDKLPWGDNAWFYIEFLSTVFFSNWKNLAGNVVYLHITSASFSKDKLEEYLYSLQSHLLLSNVVALKVIKTDLPVLLRFFESIYKKQRAPESDVKIKPILKQDMPNIVVINDYFHKTFNAYRMLSLLPTPDGKYNSRDFKFELPKDSYGDGLSTGHQLKGKFSFLRRLILVGELLTNRCWGADLPKLPIIKPEMLSILRNGLAHIEELQDISAIHLIEDNYPVLIKLYDEASTFRERLLAFIAKRQSKFHPMQNRPSRAEINDKDFNEYWNSVVKEYNERFPVLSYSTSFTPHRPLLEENEIKEFISVINNTPENKEKSNTSQPAMVTSNDDLSDFGTLFDDSSNNKKTTQDNADTPTKGKNLIDTTDNTDTSTKDPLKEAIKDKLLGKVPLDETFIKLPGEFKSRLGSNKDKFYELLRDYFKVTVTDTTNKRWLENRFVGLLQKAIENYSTFRCNAMNEEGQLLKEKEDLKNKVLDDLREKVMDDYPCIKDLVTQFEPQLKSTTKISAFDLIRILKSRILLLEELLSESQCTFSIKKKITKQKSSCNNLKSLLNNDRDFFYACCYLTTQIISMLNRLSTIEPYAPADILFVELEHKDNLEESLSFFYELRNTRLSDWVALRNGLMHSDTIIESSEASYMYMEPHGLQEAVHSCIIELLFSYKQRIFDLTEQPFKWMIMNKRNAIFQDAPIIIAHFTEVVNSLLSPSTTSGISQASQGPEHNSRFFSSGNTSATEMCSYSSSPRY
jgi:hypothetical protein